MSKQLLDEPLLDENQAKLVQLKKRTVVYIGLCTGIWTAIQLSILGVLVENIGGIKTIFPTLYIASCTYIGMFTSVLTKPYKISKQLTVLLKVFRHLTIFIIFLIVSSLGLMVVRRLLKDSFNVDSNLLGYLSVIITSSLFLLMVYSSFKAELVQEDASKPSK